MLETQFIFSSVTMVGTVFGAYLAVRVAQAELKRDVANLSENQKEILRRVQRLESPYFRGKDEE